MAGRLALDMWSRQEPEFLEYKNWLSRRRPRSVRAYGTALCAKRILVELNALATRRVGAPLSREEWVRRDNVNLLVRKSDVDKRQNGVVSAALSGPSGIGTFLLERRAAAIKSSILNAGNSELHLPSGLLLVPFFPSPSGDERFAGETKRRQEARVLYGLDCSPDALERRASSSIVTRCRELAGRCLEATRKRRRGDENRTVEDGLEIKNFNHQETARERVRRLSRRILPSIFHVVQGGERLVEGVLLDGTGAPVQGCAHTPMFLLRGSGEIVLSDEVAGAFDVRYRSERVSSPSHDFGFAKPREDNSILPFYRIRSLSKPPYKRGWTAWEHCFGRSSVWPELRGLPESTQGEVLEHRASKEETAAALLILYAEFLSKLAASSSSRRVPASALFRAAHLEFHYDRWSTFAAKYPLLLRIVGRYHLLLRDRGAEAAAQESEALKARTHH